jgi:hypothetical protein
MINLYRAELQKTIGNRWVTGFLLWIFPIGALGVIIFVSLMALAFDQFAQNFFGGDPLWTEAMIGVWSMPTNVMGQMFLIGLTAVTFAGEYQWGTWKNIIPRRRRMALIGVKFLTLGTLVVFAFVVMSIIVGIGSGIIAAVAGMEYGPTLSQEVVIEFLGNYTLQATLAFITVLITAIYAALAAMLMRSILGGVLVGLGLVIIEPIVAFLLMPLAQWFNANNLLHLIRLTPTYNINNIYSWARFDEPSRMFSSLFEASGLSLSPDSLGFSLVVLAAWVALGIGLILLLFEGQDISS